MLTDASERLLLGYGARSRPVADQAWFPDLAATLAPVRDLLLRANYLFVPAMMASAPGCSAMMRLKLHSISAS